MGQTTYDGSTRVTYHPSRQLIQIVAKEKDGQTEILAKAQETLGLRIYVRVELPVLNNLQRLCVSDAQRVGVVLEDCQSCFDFRR